MPLISFEPPENIRKPATDLFWNPPESIRKPLVFWSFQGVSKEMSGMKWVNKKEKYTTLFFVVFPKVILTKFVPSFRSFIVSIIYNHPTDLPLQNAEKRLMKDNHS